MKLSFLGQSYEASLPVVEGTETNETLTFHGKSYSQRQFDVALRQPGDELTYRGVRYHR